MLTSPLPQDLHERIARMRQQNEQRIIEHLARLPYATGVWIVARRMRNGMRLCTRYACPRCDATHTQTITGIKRPRAAALCRAAAPGWVCWCPRTTEDVLVTVMGNPMEAIALYLTKQKAGER